MICCSETTANELTEKGLCTDRVIMTSSYEELFRAIKKICSRTPAVIMENLFPTASKDDDENINQVAIRLKKCKNEARLFVLQEFHVPHSPHIFKDSINQEKLLEICQ